LLLQLREKKNRGDNVYAINVHAPYEFDVSKGILTSLGFLVQTIYGRINVLFVLINPKFAVN
jgi:hypothetical protein